MTAVEHLEKICNDRGYHLMEEYFKQAKEMEKQQIMDAFGVGCHHESKRLVGYQDIAEQYYNETYGSNGSDEIKKAEEMGLYDKIELASPNDSIFTSSQTEISDEEIEEMLFHHSNEYAYGFRDAIKWYREQLKKKQ